MQQQPTPEQAISAAIDSPTGLLCTHNLNGEFDPPGRCSAHATLLVVFFDWHGNVVVESRCDDAGHIQLLLDEAEANPYARVRVSRLVDATKHYCG